MPNGVVYCGAFKDGLQHGAGEITLPKQHPRDESEPPVKVKGVWKLGEMQ